jgi:adenylate cyclase, class 2
MRNIELKAWVADMDAARRIAEGIAEKRLGIQHQVDTYFHSGQGRLKLRQMDRAAAQLIWYAREDRPDSKASDYLVVPVSNPETLKKALAAAWGIWTVVEKRREVFLWRNVRIHLDQVEGLGHFLEFEAVLGAKENDRAGHDYLGKLVELFHVGPDQLVAESYSDLLTRG